MRGARASNHRHQQQEADARQRGRPASGTWAQWPWPRPPGGDAHDGGQQTLGTPGELADGENVLAGPTGRFKWWNEWDGGDAIDMPPDLPGGPSLNGAPPLRRLTRIGRRKPTRRR